MKSDPPSSSSETSPVITDMITWRLHTLTGLTAANATMRYQRKFQFSVQDWRVISTLGAFAPLSLKDLASRAQLEKAYASRSVAALVESDLVVSEKSSSDGRGVVLGLTTKGKKVYKRVFADAVARNENYLLGFSDKQRAAFFEMVGMMTANARRMVDLEKRLLEEGPDADGNLVQKIGSPASNTDEPTHAAEIRYLVSRLSQLVGLG